MRSFRPLALLPALLVALPACDGTTEPEESNHQIAVRSGTVTHGQVGQQLPDPLQVVVTNAETGRAARNVAVTWRVVEGAGADVSPRVDTTDASGLASTQLRLGANPGTVRVEASVPRLVGDPASFTVEAVLAPVIHGIDPADVAVGDTVTITGTNFLADAGVMAVRFGGVRGRVLDATTGRLRVVVPGCIPDRTAAVPVTVAVGAAVSGSTPLQVQGTAGDPLALAVGQVRLLASAAELECVRFPAESQAVYLVVAQNAAETAGQRLPFSLSALSGQATSPPTSALAPPIPLLEAGAFATTAAGFEARLRQKERQLLRFGGPPIAAREIQPTLVPKVGDRRTFEVINKDDEFTKVTAEVKLVGTRAVLYQDVNAPANGFSTADFQRFADLFDDPIFTVDSTHFGAPSDIDDNDRIVILFTPVVNQMTTSSSGGFIAGFFYGLDLLPNQEHSNKGEIFYSLVPDPEGKFGRRQSKETVLEVVPPVLAHELQHMIQFNQRVLVRKVDDDLLWLSEGLAHMAEDLVGEAFFARGDTLTGVRFMVFNFARAYEYLQQPHDVSLISLDTPGTLEERGAAWLLVEYLAGRFGLGILKTLSQSSRTGVDNIRAATQQPWPTLFNDWSVALWADNATLAAGLALEPRYTFPTLDVRAFLERWLRREFPLAPTPLGFTDVGPITGSLPAASPFYALLTAGTNPPPLNLTFTGRFGEPLDPAIAQLAVLRVR